MTAERGHWSGYRRPRGQRFAPWKHVLDMPDVTKGEAMQRLMVAGELTAADDVALWEYAVVPLGQRPQSQTYRNRMMMGRG